MTSVLGKEKQVKMIKRFSISNPPTVGYVNSLIDFDTPGRDCLPGLSENEIDVRDALSDKSGPKQIWKIGDQRLQFFATIYQVLHSLPVDYT